MTTEQLEEQFEQYEIDSTTFTELQSRQKELIETSLEDAMPLIQWYHKKGLYFTHPTIERHTSRGPILGFDEARYELVVYDSHIGFLRINLREKEEKRMKLTDIVEDGYFETAMEGILFLQTMMGQYLDEVKEMNARLEAQLSKYDA
ncbi:MULTISPECIES: hypothetical protein [Sporosarcina]|uniref:hypothetical protein n=1 Tax=Sporosarcina TaxID=1569 RepID=UPI0005908F7D|nr:MULTISPECIES: hypothetical protein [Sporosarcina]WJY28101.1 hypothetical protein QWT68_03715 [Sporosarcina sp. 0.2-SM1T-5]